MATHKRDRNKGRASGFRLERLGDLLANPEICALEKRVEPLEIAAAMGLTVGTSFITEESHEPAEETGSAPKPSTAG